MTPHMEYRWYHKVAAVVFAIFVFDLGLFLLIFPWMEGWEHNFFATWREPLRALWMNSYFRGTVSGVGLVNIFLSFVEVARLRRFSGS
ncbi:MAG: hypothetical protein HYZ37_09815 [Candidatus Solibacter usitatus]|nr:hypothetical protein [Candidatus Solibacter usitatus]